MIHFNKKEIADSVAVTIASEGSFKKVGKLEIAIPRGSIIMISIRSLIAVLTRRRWIAVPWRQSPRRGGTICQRMGTKWR